MNLSRWELNIFQETGKDTQKLDFLQRREFSFFVQNFQKIFFQSKISKKYQKLLLPLSPWRFSPFVGEHLESKIAKNYPKIRRRTKIPKTDALSYRWSRGECFMYDRSRVVEKAKKAATPFTIATHTEENFTNETPWKFTNKGDKHHNCIHTSKRTERCENTGDFCSTERANANINTYISVNIWFYLK